MKLLYFSLCLCLTFLSTTNSLLPQSEVRPRWKTNYEGDNIIHSPNGKFIVCVRAKDYIVRDAYTLKQICSEKFPSSYNTATPQFTPDGSRFVLFNDHEVIIVETESGRILHSLKNDIYSVEVIKISRNGKLLAVYDGRINIYEINTGNLLFTKYYEELEHTNFIDFSPDDSLIVTQTVFSEVCVLGTQEGDTLYSFYNRFPKKHAILEIINAEYVCYQSDSYDTVNIAEIRTGKFIKSIPVINTVIPPTRTRTRESILPLYNYPDSLTTIYSFPDMDPLFQFKRVKGSQNTIIYYDDYGNHLYYFDSDTLYCWNIKSRMLTAKFYPNIECCLNNLLSISPDWNTAVFDIGTHLEVIDLRTQNRVSFIESRKISNAIFSPSGDTVYTLGSLFNMQNVQTGEILNEVCSIFPQHSDLYYATDKSVISLNYLQNFVSIYDLKNNVMSDKFHFPVSTINSNININGGGRFLMLNFNYNDFARIIDVFDNSIYTVPSYFGHPFPKGRMVYAEFNIKSDKIAMCGEDAYMRPVVLIYDWLEYRTADKPKAFFLHTTHVSQVRFSNDDKYIVTSCADRTAKVWDTETKQLLFEFKHEVAVEEAQFIQNDTKVLTTDKDSSIFIWDVQSQKIIFSIRNTYQISSLETDKTGNILLINGYENSTSTRYSELWDIRKGKRLRRFDSVDKSHINKQGTKIVLVRDRCVELWDVQDIIASSFGDVLEHNASRLTISPTPAESNVEITLPTDFVCEADFEISNVFGNVVSSGIVPFSGSNKFTIDCSNLSNGMYFLTIKTNGKSASQKLIISR